MGRKRPLDERFWEKVDRTGECWLWTGATAKRPHATYGHISNGAKVDRAHRVSWVLHNGPIPVAMVVMHRCDEPLCVRPDHLRIGTQADNIADMDRKGRRRNLWGDAHPARRPGARVGERNGRALLTEGAVRQIRAMRAEGYTCRSIADALGVTFTAVRGVARGKNWAHVI